MRRPEVEGGKPRQSHWLPWVPCLLVVFSVGVEMNIELQYKKKCKILCIAVQIERLFVNGCTLMHRDDVNKTYCRPRKLVLRSHLRPKQHSRTNFSFLNAFGTALCCQVAVFLSLKTPIATSGRTPFSVACAYNRRRIQLCAAAHCLFPILRFHHVELIQFSFPIDEQ